MRANTPTHQLQQLPHAAARHDGLVEGHAAAARALARAAPMLLHARRPRWRRPALPAHPRPRPPTARVHPRVRMLSSPRGARVRVRGRPAVLLLPRLARELVLRARQRVRVLRGAVRGARLRCVPSHASAPRPCVGCARLRARLPPRAREQLGGAPRLLLRGLAALLDDPWPPLRRCRQCVRVHRGRSQAGWRGRAQGAVLAAARQQRLRLQAVQAKQAGRGERVRQGRVRGGVRVGADAAVGVAVGVCVALVVVVVVVVRLDGQARQHVGAAQRHRPHWPQAMQHRPQAVAVRVLAGPGVLAGEGQAPAGVGGGRCRGARRRMRCSTVCACASCGTAPRCSDHFACVRKLGRTARTHAPARAQVAPHVVLLVEGSADLLQAICRVEGGGEEGVGSRRGGAVRVHGRREGVRPPACAGLLTSCRGRGLEGLAPEVGLLHGCSGLWWVERVPAALLRPPDATQAA